MKEILENDISGRFTPSTCKGLEILLTKLFIFLNKLTFLEIQQLKQIKQTT